GNGQGDTGTLADEIIKRLREHDQGSSPGWLVDRSVQVIGDPAVLTGTIGRVDHFTRVEKLPKLAFMKSRGCTRKLYRRPPELPQTAVAPPPSPEPVELPSRPTPNVFDVPDWRPAGRGSLFG